MKACLRMIQVSCKSNKVNQIKSHLSFPFALGIFNSRVFYSNALADKNPFLLTHQQESQYRIMKDTIWTGDQSAPNHPH